MTASTRAGHALVMTDLADSTRLNERLGDAATADLWAEHDDVARRLMRRHGGTELQRTDGFLMRFEAVDGAIEFSIAYHGATRSLSTPLKARVAIHCGTLEIRDADGAPQLHAGIAIPLTARLMAIAGPGQTLLSDAARARMHHAGPTGRVAREPRDQWLDAAPFARFVATTRTVLGIDGEEVQQLMPMALEEGEELFKRRAASANASSS